MSIRHFLTACFMVWSTTATASESLKAFCALNDGQLIEGWTCPTSGHARTGTYCAIKNELGQELVFNGCTGVKGAYGDLFLKACTLHDFCYHYEPATSGKTKEDCDKKFLDDTLTTCDSLSDGNKRCKTVAYSFYLAVKVGGSKSWNCSKISAQHPTQLDEL